MRKELREVGAMAAAMAQITGSAAAIRSDNAVAVGAGAYRGQGAVAIGYRGRVSDRLVLNDRRLVVRRSRLRRCRCGLRLVRER